MHPQQPLEHVKKTIYLTATQKLLPPTMYQPYIPFHRMAKMRDTLDCFPPL